MLSSFVSGGGRYGVLWLLWRRLHLPPRASTGAGAGAGAGAVWVITLGQQPRFVLGYRLVASDGQQLPTRPMASQALLAVQAALMLARGSAALAVALSPTGGGRREATQNKLLDLDPPGPKPVMLLTCLAGRGGRAWM